MEDIEMISQIILRADLVVIGAGGAGLAAGVDVGGWTPDTYGAFLPGTAFGFAINSGRIAGETASKYIKEEEC
jgi:succinate dehydrogenase/fumarate reductase flavoprotein subunit